MGWKEMTSGNEKKRTWIQKEEREEEGMNEERKEGKKEKERKRERREERRGKERYFACDNDYYVP